MSPVIFTTSPFKPAVSLVTAVFRVESSLLIERSANITSYMGVHGNEWKSKMDDRSPGNNAI